MDETTGTEVALRLRDKGRQKVTVTTICGHVEVLRQRWMSAVGAGCLVPLDGWLGIADEVVTTGVMALVCLLNRGATSFQHAAECLPAATNIRLGKETLRQLCVESGQAMQRAISKGELVPEWTAKECVLPVAPTEKTPTEKTLSQVSELIEEAISRIYLGSTASCRSAKPSVAQRRKKPPPAS